MAPLKAFFFHSCQCLMFITAPLFGHEICFVQIFVTLSVLLQPHKAIQWPVIRIVYTALMLFD